MRPMYPSGFKEVGMNFKIGDRVRMVRTDVDDDSRDDLIGKIGVVVGVMAIFAAVVFESADNGPYKRRAIHFSVLEHITE